MTVQKTRQVRLLHTVKTFATIVIAAGILTIPTILNGFPFLFQDSADYLILTPRLYRSPFYGLFIQFFHLNHFIWGPVATQALIASHLLYVLVECHKLPRPEKNFIVLVLLLTLMSSLPAFVGYIMPDIFTSFMFITLYLIGFHFFSFSMPMRFYLLALACVAISAHLSHLTMAIGLAILFVPLSSWRGLAWKNIARQTAVLFCPILMTFCAFLAFNLVVFHSPSLGPAGQTFFLANLIEYGPAATYLKKVCPQAQYKICSQTNRFTEKDIFLWEEGYLDKLGGFVGMEEESRAIVSATFKNEPKAIMSMIVHNFLRGLNQHQPAAEFINDFPPWTSLFDLLKQKFGAGALRAFNNSFQMRNLIPRHLIECVDNVSLVAAMTVIIITIVLAVSRGRRDLGAFSIFMLCAVFGNILFCTTVSGIHDRYQARVTWIIVMTAYIIAASMIVQKRRDNAVS